jgi:hypothetical protein
MAEDREIEIAGKVIGENTKISLSVKTAIWIISGVVVLFSTAFSLVYFDMKAEIEKNKSQADKDKIEFFQKIEDKINQAQDKNRDRSEEMQKDIDEIKGNVKVILDRTTGPRQIEGAPTLNNNTPANSPK